MNEWSGKRVTIMGLGTRGGGAGVARYLVQMGAVVTVTDGKPAEELADPLADLSGLPIRFALGGHDERDFSPEGADLVVRNPAVPRRSPLLAQARAAGIPVEMEMSIFVRSSPAPVIGITGTKGKTSTATLCAAMLRNWRSNTVLAGNMGVSAVSHLPDLTSHTPVVLEISNWQLEGMDEAKIGPAIAVLTNIHEDHLDTYDDFDDYANTKRGIARHLQPENALIVNRDNPEAWKAVDCTDARVVPFGMQRSASVWIDGSVVRWALVEGEGGVELPDRIVYQGDHQKLNAAAAICAAVIRGASQEAIQLGIEAFQGVRDRSELVATIDGVLYINDTSATAPAAAIAALRAYPGRGLHVIAGGFDKQTNLSDFAELLATRAKSVILLEGTATPRLMHELERAGGGWLGPFDSMLAAVEAGSERARPGEIVILSPGCASFGLFRDEFDRGERFRRAVTAIGALVSQ